MTTGVRRDKVAAALRRDAGQIANLAALHLLPRLSEMDGTLRAVADQERSFRVHGDETDQFDEAAPMVEEGYRRLNSIVIFSVLVEEPALIADDLLWLQDMFGLRGLAPQSLPWIEAIFAGYTDACDTVIGTDGGAIVRDVIERALVSLQRNMTRLVPHDSASD